MNLFVWYVLACFSYSRQEKKIHLFITYINLYLCIAQSKHHARNNFMYFIYKNEKSLANINGRNI